MRLAQTAFLVIWCLLVTSVAAQSVMPDLLGLPLSAQTRFLDSLEPELVNIVWVDGSLDSGMIVTTSPIAGAHLEPEQTITIVVSSGQRNAAALRKNSEAEERSIPTLYLALQLVAFLLLGTLLYRRRQTSG